MIFPCMIIRLPSDAYLRMYPQDCTSILPYEAIPCPNFLAFTFSHPLTLALFLYFHCFSPGTDSDDCKPERGQ